MTSHDLALRLHHLAYTMLLSIVWGRFYLRLVPIFYERKKGHMAKTLEYAKAGTCHQTQRTPHGFSYNLNIYLVGYLVLGHIYHML